MIIKFLVLFLFCNIFSPILAYILFCQGHSFGSDVTGTIQISIEVIETLLFLHLVLDYILIAQWEIRKSITFIKKLNSMKRPFQRT